MRMPSKSKWVAMGLALGFSVLSVQGATKNPVELPVTPIDETPQIGVWSRNHVGAQELADREGVPIVAYLGNKGCGFCNALNAYLDSPKFKEFQKNSGMYFVYYKANDDWYTNPQTTAAMRWFVKGGSLPIVMVYWNKKGPGYAGVKTPALARNSANTNSWTDDEFIAFIRNNTQGFLPKPPSDQWDTADDVPAGATNLTVAPTNTLTAAHSLSGNDCADWFTFSAVTGKQYRVSFADVSVSGMGAEIPAVKGYASLAAVGKAEPFVTGSLADANSYVFTAASTATYYLGITRASTNTSAAVSYKLGIREFEQVSFALSASTYEASESDTNAVVTVTRGGRLTDAVAVRFKAWKDTGDDAEPVTNFTAADTLITFPAGETTTNIFVNVVNVSGVNGDTVFSVALSLPEDQQGCAVSAALGRAKVTISDADRTYDAHDKDNDSDPGDKNGTFATATALSAFAGTTPADSKDLTFDHYLSKDADPADWFKIPLETATNIQIRVSVFETRSASAGTPDDPTEVAVYLDNEATVLWSGSLSALKSAPFGDFVNAGTVYIKVAAKGSMPADQNVRYNISYCKWIDPKVAFEFAAYTNVLGSVAAMPVKVIRSENLQVPLTVEIAATNATATTADYSISPTTLSFAADESEKTFSVAILARDDGSWKPDRTFTLYLASTNAVQKTGMRSAKVTLKTTLAEGDACDGGDAYTGENDLNGTEAAPSGLTMTRQRQELDATLNGRDVVDWYAFDCVAGNNYSVKLFDVAAPEGFAVSGELYIDSLFNTPFALNAENNYCYSATNSATGAVEPYFTSGSGTAYLKVTRSPDDDFGACVTYSLAYGEWVPANVTFTTNAITVAENGNLTVAIVCTVKEEPIDVKVRVWTEENGSATCSNRVASANDFVKVDTELVWSAAEFAAATSILKRVNIPLVNLDKAWEGNETFKVKLDSLDASFDDGDYKEITVTLTDIDKADAGKLAFTAYALNDEAASPYKTGAIAAKEGDTVSVTLSRLPGQAYDAACNLVWSDGTIATNIVWKSLGASSIEVPVTIPASSGYVANKTQILTLKSLTTATPVLAGRGSLRFSVASTNESLTTYRKDITRVPFTSPGNAWFAAGDLGALRTGTLENGKKAVMSVSLKGSGRLSFDAAVTGGALAYAIGRGTPAAYTGSAIEVPAGTQTVTLTFTAQAGGGSAAISNIRWEPGDDVLRTGTFTGFIAGSDGSKVGRFTATASATGTVSGKLEFPSGAYTFKGTLDADGRISALAARRGTLDTIAGLDLAIVIDPDRLAYMTLANATYTGSAARNMWVDKPANPLAPAALLGRYFTAAIDGAAEGTDIYGSGYFTLTVSASGSARYSGVLADGRAFSGSSPLMMTPDSAFLALYTAPGAYNGGWFALRPFIDAATGAFTSADSASWVNRSNKASAYSQDGTFDRSVGAVSGGLYNTKSALADHYANGILIGKFSEDSKPESVFTVNRVKPPVEASLWGSSAGAVECALNARGAFEAASELDVKGRISLSVNKSTGLFTGKMFADYHPGGAAAATRRSMTYKGVMLQPEGQAQAGDTAGRGFYTYPKVFDGGTATESGDVVLTSR